MGLSRRTARYVIAACLLIGLSDAPPVEARKRKLSLHPHPFPEAVGMTRRCRGCSCKCGPGFRLPNNNCASWDQHWKFVKKGYPAGTVDEVDLLTTRHHHLCPPAAIKEKRMLYQ